MKVGVCAAGLLVYKDLLRVHRYTWPKILKIRYKRNSFHIDIRPEEVRTCKPTVCKSVKKTSNVQLIQDDTSALHESQTISKATFYHISK